MDESSYTLSLFGVIHSVAPGGGLYLPTLPAAAKSFELAAAYLFSGLVLAGLLASVRFGSGRILIRPYKRQAGQRQP